MERKKLELFKYLSLASLVLLLAACTTPSVIPGTGATPSLPPATPIATLPATNMPATSTPVQQPTNPPAVTVSATAAAPAGQGPNVTLADAGKTITLKVGQRFLLDLGESYNWTPVIADQSIVSRVIGILVIRGAQGIYEARAPGTTKLTVTGEPTCRNAKPLCAMPDFLFEVTLVVEK